MEHLIFDNPIFIADIMVDFQMVILLICTTHLFTFYLPQIFMPMQFKAILFDMDGVLVLSEPLHYQAWQQAIKQLQMPVDILGEDDIIGHTDRQIAQKVAARSKKEFDEKQIFSLKQDSFLSIIKNGLEEVPGREIFVKKMYGAVPMAVVSSSGRKEIEAVLHQERIKDRFEFFVGFEDTQDHKPNPAPYFLALQKIKCEAKDCLIVEDSPSGVKAAKASGCTVAGLNTSGLLQQDLDIAIFNNYHEISAWIDS